MHAGICTHTGTSILYGDDHDSSLRAHQCHYEQLGDVQGHVTVDGEDFPLSLNVMRDHTHGSTRDWRLMHRYGIQNFTTKTGFR